MVAQSGKLTMNNKPPQFDVDHNSYRAVKTGEGLLVPESVLVITNHH